MELREFAERILFGTTLDDKLAAPGPLTDLHPGPAIVAPDMPRRPPELGFKPVPGKSNPPGAGFPGIRNLDRAGQRGQVLHFFANHELLAVELMALVLLRFPDAPPAFRRDILHTLQDEQEHTRWYRDRMRDCGIQFGELPVSGHLWRLLAGMASPLDYVAGLPLTFEQANLDFSRIYSTAFSQAGDTETATLLDNIHRDEISHVAYGLKWFRRWKDPALDDWDAYQRQLRFPLSPARAKGPMPDADSRRTAGLDERFITELSVFGRSRGRAPAVHWFNPLAEEIIARGPGFTPTHSQTTLELDLSFLPVFLARRDDVVLVPEPPDTAFLTSLNEAGILLPEFEVLDRGRIDPNGTLISRPVSALRPWAWAPDSLRLLQPLFAHLPPDRQPASTTFTPERAALFGKPSAAGFLRTFLSTLPETPWICTPDAVGTPARSTDEVLQGIDHIRSTGHHRVVVKADLGLAGNSMIRLWEPTLLPNQLRWIDSRIAEGRTLLVEPWMERIADFSLQAELEPHSLRIIGYTGLQTDLRGQFMSNRAEPRFARRPPASILRSFTRTPDIGTRLHELFLEIIQQLEPTLRAAGHQGPLGIDAFVFRDPTGNPRLKPVVEINPRNTMGRLTLELMRHVAPGSTGTFRIVSRRLLGSEGFASFTEFAAHLRRIRPCQRSGQPTPRIHSGSLCLNDPSRARQWLGVFDIDPL
jgi:uncharacterized ferritin-like protein (DUF455 family)